MADPIETNSTPETTPTTEPATEVDKPKDKTWSDDYVTTLRAENKMRRIANSNYEKALRSIFKLGEDEELGNLDKRIEAFNAANQKAVDDANAKADAFIIEMELTKAIGDSYNDKLTRKLLDYSSIKVEDGKVTGLTEALQKLAEEYPEVVAQKPPKTADGTGSSKTATDKMDEERKRFRKALGLN